MKKALALALFASTLAFGQSVYNGLTGGTESFQVLVTNNSDGGAQVNYPTCVCCEPTIVVSDGGKNVCGIANPAGQLISGSGTPPLPDGGCGPMANQKTCALFNQGPNACALCSLMSQCRDQRDGPMLAAGANISLDFGGTASPLFSSCPGGNQTDGGGFGVILGR